MPRLSQRTGVPVSAAVSTVILRNNVIYEPLKLRIVNYHALAKLIAPEIEELTGEKENIETIVVAIKRFSDALPEAKVERLAAILRDTKLNLSGGLVDMTIVGKGTTTRRILKDVLALAPSFVGEYNVFQLPNSVKVIAEEKDALTLEKALSGRNSLSLKKNVAGITIRMPPSAEKVPGIMAFVTELLNRNGVSILDAFLSYEDVLIVVKEKFGPKAYQVLSEQISE
jgi:ACT domain